MTESDLTPEISDKLKKDVNLSLGDLGVEGKYVIPHRVIVVPEASLIDLPMVRETLEDCEKAVRSDSDDQSERLRFFSMFTGGRCIIIPLRAVDLDPQQAYKILNSVLSVSNLMLDNQGLPTIPSVGNPFIKD